MSNPTDQARQKLETALANSRKQATDLLNQINRNREGTQKLTDTIRSAIDGLLGLAKAKVISGAQFLDELKPIEELIAGLGAFRDELTRSITALRDAIGEPHHE